MIIRGLLPGHMIGAFESKRAGKRYKGEFVECPECGGQMHRDAKLCWECHIKQLGQVKPIAQDRRERFDLALSAGWTLEDIYGYDPEEPYDPNKDKLPTREQIMARLIKGWWANGNQ